MDNSFRSLVENIQRLDENAPADQVKGKEKAKKSKNGEHPFKDRLVGEGWNDEVEAGGHDEFMFDGELVTVVGGPKMFGDEKGLQIYSKRDNDTRWVNIKVLKKSVEEDYGFLSQYVAEDELEEDIVTQMKREMGDYMKTAESDEDAKPKQFNRGIKGQSRDVQKKGTKKVTDPDGPLFDDVDEGLSASQNRDRLMKIMKKNAPNAFKKPKEEPKKKTESKGRPSPSMRKKSRDFGNDRPSPKTNHIKMTMPDQNGAYIGKDKWVSPEEVDEYLNKGWKRYDSVQTSKWEKTTENDDPCWDSHKQIGMKKKNGKKVPNCVPESEEEADAQLDSPQDVMGGKTPTAKEIAEKHGVDITSIVKQLVKGRKIEKEHTDDAKVADEIARDHLAELPDYYDRLDKMEEGEGIDEAKQAVAGGKVQKYITGFGLTLKGEKYDEVDFELQNIDNNSGMVTLKVLPRNGHPSNDLHGEQIKVPFKLMRRGPFMATDVTKNTMGEGIMDKAKDMMGWDETDAEARDSKNTDSAYKKRRGQKAKHRELKPDEKMGALMDSDDHEISMAHSQLSAIIEHAQELEKLIMKLDDDDNLQSWVQSKLTTANDYLSKVYHHMEHKTEHPSEDDK